MKTKKQNYQSPNFENPPLDTQGLTGKAMLVDLRISQFTTSKLNKEAIEEACKDSKASKDMISAYSKLLPKEFTENIKFLMGQLRTTHYELTLPWLDSGIRILPTKNYFQYIERMNSILSKIKEADKKIKEGYQEAKKQAEKDLGPYFHPEHYPDSLEGKYEARYTILPLPSLEDFRLGIKEEGEIKSQLEEASQRFLKKAHSDILKRIHESAFHAWEKLSDKDEKFRDSLLGNIEELVESIIPILNFADNPEIESLRKAMKKLCSRDCDSLRKDEKEREKASKEAEDILEAMKAFM